MKALLADAATPRRRSPGRRGSGRTRSGTRAICYLRAGPLKHTLARPVVGATRVLQTETRHDTASEIGAVEYVRT